MPATFASLPPELVARVFDAVDARRDYLALALTCKAFSALIVPAHLALRELVLFDTHTETWDTLDAHPELAPCVRSLTLVDSKSGLAAYRSHEEVALKQRAVERVIEWIARLPRLKSFSLTNWISGSFTIRADRLERLLGSVGSELECLSLDVLSLSPNTKFYEMRNLRVLELGLPQLSVQYWSDVCYMLSQSPRLEVLELPPFWCSYLPQSESQPLQPLPPLPLLVQFSCAVHGTADSSLRLLEFLNSSPTIVELRCEGWPPASSTTNSLRRRTIWPRSARTTPELPNLRRIYDRASAEFACAFLRGKPPRSVALEALECMELDSNSNNDRRALDDYAALDPARLRVLHVFRLGRLGESVHTSSADSAARLLERVAQMFPAVEDLRLPVNGTYRGRRKTLLNRSSAPFTQEFPKLSDVVALFPRLRRVDHVDVDVDVGPGLAEMHDPLLWTLEQPYPTDARVHVLEAVARTMDGIRERFPRLERVNGWLIEDGERGKTRVVQLCPARGDETWRRNLSTKYVLTCDGLEEECCRERGFVSRPPLDATTLELCSNSGQKSARLEGLKSLKTALLARRSSVVL